VLFSLLTSFDIFPAFSWLVKYAPALLFVIPVIFAPEIRRTLERLPAGRFYLPGSLRMPRAYRR
jgi:hypothetical protein